VRTSTCGAMLLLAMLYFITMPTALGFSPKQSWYQIRTERRLAIRHIFRPHYMILRSSIIRPTHLPILSLNLQMQNLYHSFPSKWISSLITNYSVRVTHPSRSAAVLTTIVTDPYLNYTVTNYTMSAPLGPPINDMSQYNTSEGIIISSGSNQLQMENENWTNQENISILTTEETHESSNKEDTHQHHDLLQVPQDFFGDATAESITKSQSACLESGDTSTKAQHYCPLPPARRGGRRGPLTSAQAEHQRQARSLGVCIRCRKTRIKVNPLLHVRGIY
jgi:hypothetical protein